jgi:hypothetical protein
MAFEVCCRKRWNLVRLMMPQRIENAQYPQLSQRCRKLLLFRLKNRLYGFFDLLPVACGSASQMSPGAAVDSGRAYIFEGLGFILFTQSGT